MPAIQMPLFDDSEVDVANPALEGFLPEKYKGVRKMRWAARQPLDIADLQATRTRLMGAERTANTIKAYTLGWTQFARWCDYYGRDPLPASSDTIQLFITALIQRQRRLKTVKSYLTGIVWKHLASSFPSPLDYEIKALMQNAARELKEPRRGKAALSIEQLRQICLCGSTDDAIDVRDRAIFVLGFASGWRGGEIVSLNLGDVQFCESGVVLSLGASKTDQEGKGRVVGLHPGSLVATCPVHALQDWMRMRGDWPGPLFVRITSHTGDITEHRITRETVGQRLKVALKSIGVNPTSFGSHSLRIGMVTASAEAGHTPQQIMGRTGQKTTTTVEGYIRRDPGRLFLVNPLKGVL